MGSAAQHRHLRAVPTRPAGSAAQSTSSQGTGCQHLFMESSRPGLWATSCTWLSGPVGGARKREENTLLAFLYPLYFPWPVLPLEFGNVGMWFNMVGLVLVLPLSNGSVALSHIRVSHQKGCQPFCLGPSCSYSRTIWKVPLNVSSNPESQLHYCRYSSMIKKLLGVIWPLNRIENTN